MKTVRGPQCRSHLEAGAWGVTEMLASFDPGIGLAGGLSTVAAPSEAGGVAHTAQAVDGLIQSQPASQTLHHTRQETYAGTCTP